MVSVLDGFAGVSGSGATLESARCCDAFSARRPLAVIRCSKRWSSSLYAQRHKGRKPKPKKERAVTSCREFKLPGYWDPINARI